MRREAAVQSAYFKHVANVDCSALDFLNVRFLVAGPGRGEPGRRWRRVYAGEDGTVFENADVLPRAFAQQRLRPPAPGARLRDLVTSLSWRTEAVLVEDPRRPDRSLRTAKITVRCMSPTTPNRPTPPFSGRTLRPGGAVVVASLVQDGGWFARDETSGRSRRESQRSVPRDRSAGRRSSDPPALRPARLDSRGRPHFRDRRRLLAAAVARRVRRSARDPPTCNICARVAGETRWDDGKFTAHLESLVWTASPIVRRYLHALVSGDPGCDWLTWVEHAHLAPGLDRALVLGCGSGWLERALAARPVSGHRRLRLRGGNGRAGAQDRRGGGHRDDRIRSARPREREASRRVRSTRSSPTTSCTTSPGLEPLFARIHDALAPEGRLIFNEYVGPNRFQYSDARMDLVNRYLRLLPDRLRWDPLGGHILWRRERIDERQLDHRRSDRGGAQRGRDASRPPLLPARKGVPLRRRASEPPPLWDRDQLPAG